MVLHRPRILVLRPRGTDIAELDVWAENRGAELIHQPALRIQYLDGRAESFSGDYAIFTSAAACRGWFRRGGRLDVERVFAVGRGTATVLAGFNLPNVERPEVENSDGILALLPEALSNKRVLVVKGVGGRRVLTKILRLRGAAVEVFKGYRRLAMPLQGLAGATDDDMAWLTSTMTARALALIDTRWPVAAISTRVADAARKLGFRRVYNLKSARTERFIHFLDTHYG